MASLSRVGGGLRIDRCARHGGHLKLSRTVGEGIERQHAGEDQDRGDREQQDVADDSEQPAHDQFHTLVMRGLVPGIHVLTV